MLVKLLFAHVHMKAPIYIRAYLDAFVMAKDLPLIFYYKTLAIQTLA